MVNSNGGVGTFDSSEGTLSFQLVSNFADIYLRRCRISTIEVPLPVRGRCPTFAWGGALPPSNHISRCSWCHPPTYYKLCCRQTYIKSVMPVRGENLNRCKAHRHSSCKPGLTISSHIILSVGLEHSFCGCSFCGCFGIILGSLWCLPVVPQLHCCSPY